MADLTGYIDCDVCGLPDPYAGTGDGIGSCECPRCDGGEAAENSVLCTCPPSDVDGIDGYWDDDDFLAYLPEGRIRDMLRYPDNRHLY